MISDANIKNSLFYIAIAWMLFAEAELIVGIVEKTDQCELLNGFNINTYHLVSSASVLFICLMVSIKVTTNIFNNNIHSLMQVIVGLLFLGFMTLNVFGAVLLDNVHCKDKIFLYFSVSLNAFFWIVFAATAHIWITY